MNHANIPKKKRLYTYYTTDSEALPLYQDNLSKGGFNKILLLISILMIVLLITGCNENIPPQDGLGDKTSVDAPATEIIKEDTVQDINNCLAPQINGRTTVCSQGCQYNNLADALKNSNNIVITDCGTYRENIVLEKDDISIDCNNAVLDGTGLQTALDINSVSKTKIENCIFINYNFAISLLNSDNVLIENNKFNNNKIAVRVKLGFDNILRSNSFSNNEQAILIVSSNNALVSKNKVSESNKNGLELTGSSKKCVINDNEFYSNKESGIKNVAIGNTISNNIFSNNLRYGIECQPGFEVSISDNVCKNNVLGGCNGCAGCEKDCAQ